VDRHSYVFDAGNRSIIAEIFLPRRISLQGTLYETLEDGLNHSKVREYLVEQAISLKKDYLSAYAEWFDPKRYGHTNKRGWKSLGDDAKDRVRRCKQVFFGWSTYEVSGVFLKKNGIDIDEEQTQVIRIIFKYDVPKELKDRRAKKYPEVLRAILYWVVSTYGLTDGKAWDDEKFESFIARFPQWSKEQKSYAKKRFVPIANDINIWIDDCGIFLFGYVIHNIWTEIVKMNQEGLEVRKSNAKERRKNRKYQPAPQKRTHLEDEIWVTSIFRYDVNVSRSVKLKSATIPRRRSTRGIRR